jgi:SlyX protein
MTDHRLTRIEERLAETERMAEELSALVHAQAAEIDRLTRRVALLMEREAEREADGAGTVPLADKPPPHW